MIAEELIDVVIRRTLSGKDKDGNQFQGLSADYKKLKIAATGSGKANLRLSGEMLGSLEYKANKSSSTKIVIGYQPNTEENAKAKGHITGDVGVQRDFLGVSDSERDDILDKYEKTESNILAAASLLRRAFGDRFEN